MVNCLRVCLSQSSNSEDDMITVSQDYKDALAADNRNFYCVADITLWNGTTLSVDNTNIWQGITALEWFSSTFHINSFHQTLFSLAASN